MRATLCMAAVSACGAPEFDRLADRPPPGGGPFGIAPQDGIVMGGVNRRRPLAGLGIPFSIAAPTPLDPHNVGQIITLADHHGIRTLAAPAHQGGRTRNGAPNLRSPTSRCSATSAELY